MRRRFAMIAVFAISCSGGAPASSTSSDAGTDTGAPNCGPTAPFPDTYLSTFIGSCSNLTLMGLPACKSWRANGPKDWTSEEEAACASLHGDWSATEDCVQGKIFCFVEAPPAEPCSVNTKIDYARGPATPGGENIEPPDLQSYCPPGASYGWMQ